MRTRKLFIAVAAVAVGLSLTLLISPIPAAGQTLTVLHSFTTGQGVSPLLGLIFDSSGNLYGVAAEGGGSNAGTIFELSPSGSTWNEKTLYTFKGSTDGAEPVATLIFDKSGNLYGTTKLGGTNGTGTAFELIPSGATWTKKILHNFGAKGDGAFPMGSLAIDSSGNLFGMTMGGGANGNGQVNVGGTAFKLTNNAGTWTEAVIHSFGGGTDGAVPKANMIFDKSGNLYGTTFKGGAYTWGTVFELSPQSGGAWKESVLYSFNPSDINLGDGALPVAGLIFDSAGNIYGTNSAGGSESGGTVFELSPKSGGKWTESVLWTFQYDGYQPSEPHAGVIMDKAGNFYGATFRGFGPDNKDELFDGTIFELVPQSGGWNMITLYAFDGAHGTVPVLGSLIMDSSGNLYGAASGGGANNNGTVFKIVP